MTPPTESTFPLDPALSFLQKLWHMNHALERLSSDLEGRLGVTAQQRFVLRCVGAYPGITAGQLGTLLHIDPGTVSATVRRLEGKGLILRRRDPSDGRRVFLGLTSRGRALDVWTNESAEGAVAELLKSGPSEGIEQALGVLTRLTALLESRVEP